MNSRRSTAASEAKASDGKPLKRRAADKDVLPGAALVDGGATGSFARIDGDVEEEESGVLETEENVRELRLGVREGLAVVIDEISRDCEGLEEGLEEVSGETFEIVEVGEGVGEVVGLGVDEDVGLGDVEARTGVEDGVGVGVGEGEGEELAPISTQISSPGLLFESGRQDSQLKENRLSSCSGAWEKLPRQMQRLGLEQVQSINSVQA